MQLKRGTPNATSEAVVLGEFYRFVASSMVLACHFSLLLPLASGTNLKDNVMVDLKMSRFMG